jgi:LPXTG-motif cell wall-anchored protein
VNNKLVDKVTKDDFAGFEGTVCDEDGNVLFASAPVNPTPTPATGSMTVVIAAGAILASLGAVVALKKREER